MERNVVRINGNLERLHRVSDEELGSYLFHTVKRLESAQNDLDILHNELGRRFNVELPLGDTALQDTVEFEPHLEGYAELADQNRWDDMGTY